MKRSYLVFVLLSLFSFTASRAATTIQTGNYAYTFYYYQSTPIQAAAITFVVNNTNSYPITIQKVGYSSYNPDAHSLYYSATSTTGSAGNITGSSDWIMADTKASTSVYFSTIADDFFNCCVTIPANTKYRFAVVGATNVLFGSNVLPSATAYGSGGVYLDASESRYGLAISCANSGYGYYGSITFTTCETVGGLNAANITATTADLSWTALAGATGYEYAIDQTARASGAAIPTTGTTVNATSLIPNTNYYLHVRNVCSSTDKSCWTDYPFTTMPPCTVPEGFAVTNLTPTLVDFKWDPVVIATSYDYVVDQSPNTPAVTGAISTINTNGTGTPLTEGTLYYVHIRTNCGTQQTAWSLDSFVTPIPCRAPVVNIDYLNVDQAVAFWDGVKTATTYEYAVTKSSAPPAVGTKITATSVVMSALLDGVQYYIHTRSHCTSEGIVDVSPWATTAFKTFPLGVSAINGSELGLEVYPNPAQNTLNVKVLGALQHNTVLTLTDIQGRVLKQISMNKQEMTVDISSLAPGIYQLKYKDDANTKTIKVAKQ